MTSQEFLRWLEQWSMDAYLKASALAKTRVMNGSLLSEIALCDQPRGREGHLADQVDVKWVFMTW